MWAMNKFELLMVSKYLEGGTPILIFNTKIIRFYVIIIKISIGALLMKPYSDECKANIVKLHHDENVQNNPEQMNMGIIQRPSVIGSSKLNQLNCLKVAR